MHFFKNYFGIKIEDHKILIPMSELSPTLDEVNAIYHFNPVRLLCISSIYHILMQFLMLRIKIEDHKVLVSTSVPSWK